MKNKRKIIKRVVPGFIAMLILLSGFAALADGKGDTFNLSYNNVYEKEGELMVPLREVAEELDLDIKWIKESGLTVVKNKEYQAYIEPNSSTYVYDDNKSVKLVSSEVKDGVTYVPKGFFEKIYNVDMVKPVHGVVEEITPKSDELTTIYVKRDTDFNDQFEDIILQISEKTSITDELGNEVSLGYIKKGSKIYVTLPEVTTMSIPAKGVTPLIVVKNRTGLKQETENLNKINNKIRSIVASYKDSELYENVKIERKISYYGNGILGVLFEGSFDYDGLTRRINREVNFDLKTGKEIDFYNFFKQDDTSQKKLKEIFSKKAKEIGEELKVEAMWISFRGDLVVVSYHPLDDLSNAIIDLEVPLSQVKDLIK